MNNVCPPSAHTTCQTEKAMSSIAARKGGFLNSIDKFSFLTVDFCLVSSANASEQRDVSCSLRRFHAFIMIVDGVIKIPLLVSKCFQLTNRGWQMQRGSVCSTKIRPARSSTHTRRIEGLTCSSLPIIEFSHIL